jgi:hypothetical protein
MASGLRPLAGAVQDMTEGEIALRLSSHRTWPLAGQVRWLSKCLALFAIARAQVRSLGPLSGVEIAR